MELGPPTSIIKQENTSEIRPQGNLTNAISLLSFPLPR